MAFFNQLQQDTVGAQHYLLSSPIIGQALQGQISLPNYIAFLQRAYHHVKHTVPLLMATGARLPDKHEWLRHAIAEYIEEEIGHEEWILNDIRACGGDAEAVRASAPTIAVDCMVAYAYDCVMRRNPLMFFGMVHVLEGTSTALATQAAQMIRNRLQLPNAAFSYLLSHGSLDQEHVVFFESLMNKIDDPADQLDILFAANRFYHLYGNIFREIQPEETQSWPLAS